MFQIYRYCSDMKRILFLVVITGLTLISCNKLDGEVKMKVGETTSNEDISLKFVDYSDSRCPEGTTCISAGHVTVWMEMQSDTATRNFAIGNEESPYEIQFSAMNYNVRFIDLTPHPKEGKTIKTSDVKLHLQVSKL